MGVPLAAQAWAACSSSTDNAMFRELSSEDAPQPLPELSAVAAVTQHPPPGLPVHYSRSKSDHPSDETLRTAGGYASVTRSAQLQLL
jgi:hypothetical protein